MESEKKAKTAERRAATVDMQHRQREHTYELVQSAFSDEGITLCKYRKEPKSKHGPQRKKKQRTFTAQFYSAHRKASQGNGFTPENTDAVGVKTHGHS